MANIIYKKSIFALKILSIVACTIIIFGSTFLIYRYYKNNNCKKTYSFINSTLVCNESPVIKKTGYAKLQSELENYIENEKEKNNIINTSIYFRDLKNGPVFGINETAEFAPASLLKLPLAFVYLNWAEKDEDILNKQLIFKGGLEDFNQTFSLGEKLIVNNTYTIEELIMRMLKYSDNDSYATLIDYLLDNNNEQLLTQTFLELGFIAPQDAYDEVISVRRYGSIFRALYNSSILNTEKSERVLEWLSNSNFNDGIVAGVPKDIKVSHKFGERFYEDGLKQLHDCGIVYFPKNPYLLCVMTRGKDFIQMSKVIENISREVYREVEGRKI